MFKETKSRYDVVMIPNDVFLIVITIVSNSKVENLFRKETEGKRFRKKLVVVNMFWCVCVSLRLRVRDKMVCWYGVCVREGESVSV